MRTIAIGDIHGCAKALKAVVDAIGPEPDDRLIFLGDYVDRGPDSRGVIDQLLALRQRCQTICLLGNHEIVFRGVLNGLPETTWLEVGGRATLASYGGLLKNVPLEHVDFLFALEPYYETEKAFFVHANYDARLPMCEQTEQTLYWEHLGDRTPEPHFSGKHVFLGHTPQLRGAVGYFGHFTCLDTFCFGGGWLTAMDVDNGSLWQASRDGRLKKTWRILKLLRSKMVAWRCAGGGASPKVRRFESKASNLQ